MLDGELLYTKILEVNLFAFAYRLFHEDFSSIDAQSRIFVEKLTSEFFVYKDLWALHHLRFSKILVFDLYKHKHNHNHKHFSI